MMVRPKKSATRKGQTPKPIAQSYTFVSPIRGWVLDENLATVGPGSARILDNFICTTTGVRPRGGARKHATLGSGVCSMFTYRSGATEKHFAATDTDVFDITTVVDPDVTPAAAISALTSGAFSDAQFGTAGGDFTILVNGSDAGQVYDGTAFAAMSVTGVSTSALSHVWSYANRLFFVEKDTLSAWYLPVDSIGGAMSEFSLAGVMQKGGSLLLGARWSLDAGDGLDDKCLFISTEGEVAVYEGSNPGSASDWRLVGLYSITKPLGSQATMQAGGDLLVCTESGLVPISKAIQYDEAALSVNAVSRQIAPYWQRQARIAGFGWEIVKWPEENIALITQPSAAEMPGTCLVVNLQTQAWSRVKGWNATCWGYAADRVYFGADDGFVYRADVEGNDNGVLYTCVYLGQHETLGVGGMQKTVHQMRAIFDAKTLISPSVTAKVDFDTTISPPPNSVADIAGSSWDTAVWDASEWDGDISSENARWRAIGRTGYTFAPEVQLSFGVPAKPDAELVSIEATFTVGALVA